MQMTTATTTPWRSAQYGRSNFFLFGSPSQYRFRREARTPSLRAPHPLPFCVFRATMYRGSQVKYGPDSDKTHHDVSSLADLHQWLQVGRQRGCLPTFLILSLPSSLISLFLSTPVLSSICIYIFIVFSRVLSRLF